MINNLRFVSVKGLFYLIPLFTSQQSYDLPQTTIVTISIGDYGHWHSVEWFRCVEEHMQVGRGFVTKNLCCHPSRNLRRRPILDFGTC